MAIAEVISPTHAKVDEMQNLTMHSPQGGTCFRAALRGWHGILNNSQPVYKEAVLFLTDGYADVPTKELEDVLRNHGKRLVSFTSVAFGTAAGTGMLKTMHQIIRQQAWALLRLACQS